MINYKVFIFTYNFPHLKTIKICQELILKNIKIEYIIAAPFKKLPQYSDWSPFKKKKYNIISISEFAKSNNIPYLICDHNNSNKISKLIKKNESNIGIIGGARILNIEIIKLFRYGIINYHPGKIPETSGLDSFYWMLEKNVSPSVTAHFINYKVDEGEEILNLEVLIEKDDTLDNIYEKVNNVQFKTHSIICDYLKDGKLFVKKKLIRPNKNLPMNNLQRKQAINKFQKWKNIFSIN